MRGRGYTGGEAIVAGRHTRNVKTSDSYRGQRLLGKHRGSGGAELGHSRDYEERIGEEGLNKPSFIQPGQMEWREVLWFSA